MGCVENIEDDESGFEEVLARGYTYNFLRQ